MAECGGLAVGKASECVYNWELDREENLDGRLFFSFLFVVPHESISLQFKDLERLGARDAILHHEQNCTVVFEVVGQPLQKNH